MLPPQAAGGAEAGTEANATAHAGLEISAEGEENFLTTPKSEKLAAVIDGQHRLFAFARADPARVDDRLLCSVFIDLPKSMQA